VGNVSVDEVDDRHCPYQSEVLKRVSGR
jgi:hypothetical protein